MSFLLNNLTEEYIKLSKEIEGLVNKRDKISELIKEYGGTVPFSHEFETLINLPEFIPYTEMYPIYGTRKEKILFALKYLPRPVTALEITEFMIKLEGDESKENRNRILAAVTQTCSSMGVSGEIEVEQGYRNKYYLKR